MARRPAEKYYQTTGRRHLGLSHPERYGLTYEEVVRLVDENRWRLFYIKWRRKQKQLQAIKLFKYVCPSCDIKIEDITLWSLNGKQCKQCDQDNNHKIRVEAGRVSSALGKSRGPGKNVLENKNFCSICRRWQKNVVFLGKIRACGPCIKKA